MHVDDVRDRAQLADRGQGPAALDARFQREQEEGAGPHEDDVVDAGLEELDELEDLQGLVRAVQREHGTGQAGGDDREQGAHADAQPQDRGGDPGRALPGLPGDAVQLAAHAAQAGVGEALVDAPAQERDRARDRVRIEAEVRHGGESYPAPSGGAAGV